MKLKALQAAFAMGIGLAGTVSHAGVLLASDSGFSILEGSSVARMFTIGPGGPIADVGIKIDFAKCHGTAMEPPLDGLQKPCPDAGVGEESAGEIYFYLVSPTGTRVDLVYTYSTTPEGIAQGSTKVAGTYPDAANVGHRVQVDFDDEAAALVGPIMATTGLGVRPEEPLSAFDGQNPMGTWTLWMGDSAGTTPGADPMSYFSSFLYITTVPEPNPLALLGIGLLGLGALHRRKGLVWTAAR